MVNSKVVVGSVITAIVYYYIHENLGLNTYISFIVQSLERKVPIFGGVPEEVTEEPKKKVKLYSKEQLALYDGKPGSKGLYLALLGKVYDVSKGSQHYGPEGGYHFFSGRDATRAFVTGDFSEAGLTDDIEGLSPKDILGLDQWDKFYKKDYKYKGKIIGRFYNADGSKTRHTYTYEEMLKSANAQKRREANQKLYFPPCNSEWTQESGGRVYCSKKSGGIQRDWVGVPRKYFDSEGQQVSCVCVRDSGPPTEVDVLDRDRGDLDDPRLREYENCDPSSISCVVK